jgi:hypothetical protein
VELLLDSGPRWRQMFRHDLPDTLEIDVEVGVRGDVAEAADLPLRDLAMPILEPC